jgi:hypothetical protein
VAEYALAILIAFLTFVIVVTLVLYLLRYSLKTLVPVWIGVVLVAFVVNLGLLAYSAEPISELNAVLWAFFDSLQMLTGGGDIDPTDFVAGAGSSLVLTLLQFAKWALRLLAISITASAVVSIIGNQFIAHFRLIFKPASEICLLYGYTTDSVQLANSLSDGPRAARRIVAIISDEFHAGHIADKPGKGLDLSKGILVFSRSNLLIRRATSRLANWLFASKGKPRVMVFLFDDRGPATTNTTLHALEAMLAEALAARRLTLEFYLIVNSAWATGLFESSGNTHIARVLNRARIKARRLIGLMESSANSPSGGGALNNGLILGGLGHSGQEILRHLIMNGQYPDTRLSLAVVDKNLAGALGMFRARYPLLDEVCTLDCYEYDVGSEDFYNLLTQLLEKQSPAYIVIELGDERFNLHTAFVLRDWYLGRHQAPPRIYVSVESGQHNLIGSVEGIFPYGAAEDLMTEQVVANGELDFRARLVNYYYTHGSEQGFVAASVHTRAGREQMEQEWQALDFWKKESSRASADYYLTMQALQQMAAEQEDPELLLAQAEHQRWNAFHIMNGYQAMSLAEMQKRFDECCAELGVTPTAEPDADLLNQAGSQARLDMEHRRHVCLVDWEALEAVSAAYNTLTADAGFKHRDFQTTDRDVARMLEALQLMDTSG